MKKGILLVAMLLGAFAFSQANAQSTANTQTEIAQATDSATFQVNGKCGMCKKRIEKVANELEGVSSANWDVESKEFTAQYDASKVSEKEIQQKIASVGHDTEKVKATDAAYNNLPGCCKYARQES